MTAHHDGNELWPRGTRTLLGRPVRVGEVTVGRVGDLLFNETLGHALGFVVVRRPAFSKFLPWVAAEVRADDVGVRSVFSLLSASELSSYLDHGARLSEALGSGREGLADVLVDRHGDVAAIIPSCGRLARRPPWPHQGQTAA